MMKYTIYAIPPTLSEYAERHRLLDYRDAKQTFEEVVRYCCDKPERPMLYGTLKISFYFSDDTQVCSYQDYLPMILKGLIKAGAIVDESWQRMPQLILTGAVDKKNPRIEIETQEIEQ